MKRLVICADGTWNERDQVDKSTGKRRPTNVTKLARGVLPRAADGADQVVYYHDGIGTGGPLDSVTGGAFGEGMEQQIRAMYRFVSYNYVDGDQIYLFGFSRGAFTVRSLAGFMYRVGLLQKDDDYFVPDIYRCYENNFGPGTPEWAEAFRHVKDHRSCPPIRCIGVWDTVGALGAPGALGQVLNRDKYQYHAVGLNPTIENGFHALAVDERRKPFLPTLWQRPAGWTGILQQVWFPGVHSNIGGGYTPDGLANEALHWMVEKAEGLGLAFDAEYLKPFRPCFNSELKDSMTIMYKVMGPQLRAIGKQPADGEMLHQAAIDRMNHAPSNYAPANLPADAGAAWHSLPVTNTTRMARGEPC